MRFNGKQVLDFGDDWIEIDDNGPVRLRGYDEALIELAAGEVSPADQQANASSLRTKAASALATNRDFLALASPTNAQVVAQVKALTRQNNGLIRLVIRQLDGTD